MMKPSAYHVQYLLSIEQLPLSRLPQAHRHACIGAAQPGRKFGITVSYARALIFSEAHLQATCYRTQMLSCNLHC